MTRKPKRVVFRVQWLDGEWVYSHDHDPDGERGWIMFGATKSVLVQRARQRAKSIWLDHGIPTQLVIHGKDGRIQREHTYGADPRRTKG